MLGRRADPEPATRLRKRGPRPYISPAFASEERVMAAATTVAMAADHAGFALKDELKAEVEAQGFDVLDLGTDGPASVDYPDMADRLADALASGRAARGVLVCGTGVGISIAANRHRHVRAALCADSTTARLAREHNDSNVLALGARVVGVEVARACVRAFLETPFAAGRHERRVARLG